jgi:putative SOS response-associated peptidase YedK
MCGRYVRKSDKQRLREAFHLRTVPDSVALAPNYNVAPTTFQPVIRADKETGERELVTMRWGMVPYFAKSLADFNGFSTINAKAETLTTKPMWRGPFQQRRCLVPADAFYEWATLDAKTKQPYAFTMRSGEPFAFAGLWDAWKEPDGGLLQSFAIITTDPNELAATVHNRMPVILKPSDYDRWLMPDDPERPPVDLLRPYNAGEMRAYPVDPRVGNVRNNEPSLCDVYKRLPNSI